jgi:hypothetical protein
LLLPVPPSPALPSLPPLAFLCRGNLGLLPVLRVRGDRALRLSFRHDALVRAAMWEEVVTDELLLGA